MIYNNLSDFSVTTTSGQVVIVKSRIFLWPSDSKIVISDVDGTITKSDLLGHIMPRFGVNYSHEGVVSLYSTIEKHGYKLVYPDVNIIVQGHASDDGSESYNMKISQTRADAVAAALQAAGIDANRISTEAYGETKPLSDRKSSRRVEFNRQMK